ncbi:NYN domain-containing protein [Secundilactobacillus malefermentans]|uniref:NYN domain-containing protein n=1 Tax=Secundilactobacillus malefermentans TaxID=176292 RepID=A0A4R5NNF1_9LACO|nr:NYN domain-containing protein [Secundilactobacillus malefermentans]KRM58402.1 hypothetical protein FD44_GL000727 [Secundilactobacillus malefermentans DSM 5705 = KCTC 3548]QEA32001.1 NYN domain-containing protein [Secundilactobacillus malefermentans]TDG77827.1 hypothetical protein C5L31_000221 [Secundilactobacillus malefermentans]
MKKELLIVDAYNLIGSWPELKQLKLQDRLEDARDRLIQMMVEYRKYRAIEIVVVFDAMYVPGVTQNKQYRGLEVVWTAKNETADSYIEALAKEKQSRLLQVTVATNDQAEQWMIFSEGALRIPGDELLGDIHLANKEVTKQTSEYADQLSVRKSPWDNDQLTALEQLREKLTDKGKKNK